MSSSFTFRLLEAAESGVLILTSNKRLARQLHEAYDRQMQEQGCRVWRPPQILSYEVWLHSCLAELGEEGRLLNGFTAQRLWERLIEESLGADGLNLLQISSTARRAQEAHNLLAEYGCTLNGLTLTEDQQAFRQWRQRYVTVCKEEKWLDSAQLTHHVCQALAEGRLKVPGKVLLAGFDQWSPRFDLLKCTLHEVGGSLEEVYPEPPNDGVVGRISCPDAAQEVETAARWARRLLDGGESSVGIVVPDLHSRRGLIERVFRAQIDPGSLHAPGQEEGAFSLSLGSALSEQGAIHAAIEILSCGYRLSMDKASFLLRTPYLMGSQTEADRRALFDRTLRGFRQQEIGLGHLGELASKNKRLPQMSECFKSLLRHSADRSLRLPGEWVVCFDQQLKEVGWPGERALSSRDFQVVKACYEKLFPTLSSLDPVSLPIGRSQAVALLRRLAGECEFQIEAASGPVQVVGLLESAGLDFDHLWVMGFDEETIPAPPRPNPFIPIHLQIEKQMPHAGADRELVFSRRVLQRLLASSPQVIFSFPRRQGDSELRPSPLIESFPVATPTLAERHDPVHILMESAPETQMEKDCQGPSLRNGVGCGGTAILRDQALCPFRSFAHHRLHARLLEEPHPGIDPMARGTLLHRGLERFWREIVHSSVLRALDESARLATVAEQVDAAIEDYYRHRPAPSQVLLDLERQRLRSVIGEWLEEVELRRTPFTVEVTEQKLSERIGPLTIETVVDRIDQLENGRRVLLDYKTGLVKLDGLLGERLLEPQLPIYVVASDDDRPEAVAFARVRRGDCRLIGVASASDLLPKVAGVKESRQASAQGIDDWERLLAHWQRQLEALAEDFVQGRAGVDPVSSEDACRFCDLPGLCRIDEATHEEESI